MSQTLTQHVISSNELSINVVPSLGGRLTGLTDLVAGRQWLWRNHRLPLGPVKPGSVYDDVWQGGFEELFPSDARTEMNGVHYPDHGELWSVPWQVVDRSYAALTMSVVGPTTGVRVTKSLRVDGRELTVQYRLEHDGDSVLPHLFKLHPAFLIDDNCRIDLPGGIVEKVERSFGNLLETTETQTWPTEVDLAQCRSQTSRTNEFVYVSDLPEGWCGITDIRTDSWVRINYPIDTFPYCWIFMTYGGWREHEVVVLEPCTNYPKDLSEAIANGTSAFLPPSSTTEFQVGVSVGACRD